MPSVKAIRDNYCLQFGHYNHKSHTCLFNYEHKLCEQCRLATKLRKERANAG